jgi:hypothetical protein
VQRERPDGSNSVSFPSGHSASAFATATVRRELRIRRLSGLTRLWPALTEAIRATRLERTNCREALTTRWNVPGSGSVRRNMKDEPTHAYENAL